MWISVHRSQPLWDVADRVLLNPVAPPTTTHPSSVVLAPLKITNLQTIQVCLNTFARKFSLQFLWQGKAIFELVAKGISPQRPLIQVNHCLPPSCMVLPIFISIKNIIIPESYLVSCMAIQPNVVTITHIGTLPLPIFCTLQLETFSWSHLTTWITTKWFQFHFLCCTQLDSLGIQTVMLNIQSCSLRVQVVLPCELTLH